MNRSKKSSAITLVFSYLSLSCFLLLANTHNSFITSTHAFDIFNILPTVEPGSNHFLTDIIVGVINRTDIKSIHVNLTDLSIDDPGLYLNASLDKLRVGIGIESDKIILPILGESDKTFFDCNLTMGALNISANLQSETIPLVCHLPPTAEVSMGINIYAGTNELDVNMSLKDTSFIASMDTKIMPMNINMSLNGVTLGLDIRQLIFDDGPSWIVFIIAFVLQWGMLFLHFYDRYCCYKLAKTLKNVPSREMTSKMVHCIACNSVSPFEAKFCGGCGRHVASHV